MDERQVLWSRAQLAAGCADCRTRGVFGAIIGALNHLVVADAVWLKRFTAHSSPFKSLVAIRELDKPKELHQILFAGLQELWANGIMFDSVIVRWAEELTEADLQSVITYTNMKGVGARKTRAALLMHFFNRQTSHRGQATTLLTQAGQDVGVTDVLALISGVEGPTVSGA